MIDTDRYEGHTPGPWRTVRRQRDDTGGDYLDIVDVKNGDLVTWTSFFAHYPSHRCDHPNVRLMEDAPLLLEAYRELQDYHTALLNWVMNHLDRDEDEVKEMIYE
jgi:hypothetical protein|tara:strand:+ start:239 stop:553 length:315 start_codon:yes stop_codon:yes gene_type:complete